MNIGDLLAQLIALGGIAALIAVIVDGLKQFGVVKDGDAATWSTAFNVLALVVLFALKVFKPDLIPQADSLAKSIAQLGVVILALLSQFGVSKATHMLLLGVPLVNKSFSRRL